MAYADEVSSWYELGALNGAQEVWCHVFAQAGITRDQFASVFCDVAIAMAFVESMQRGDGRISAEELCAHMIAEAERNTVCLQEHLLAILEMHRSTEAQNTEAMLRRAANTEWQQQGTLSEGQQVIFGELRRRAAENGGDA